MKEETCILLTWRASLLLSW